MKTFHSDQIHSPRAIAGQRRSLAWLLIGAIGSALATIVVAGIVAGRLRLPIAGTWLLAAGLLGALPQLLAIARRRWVARWAELAAALIGFAAVGGLGLALAWPSLLPLGFSVDAVHHTQLIGWMADHHALPTPGGSTQALLGEMAAYPVGLALLILASASASGQPLLEATYPTVALLGGLIAAVVVLLSSAAGGELRMENEKLRSAPVSSIMFNSQFSILNFLALLAGPLLLLAHRTYLLEAYIDHSYYTMVLGVLLVLLALAWLLIEPPRSLGSAAQFGLVLAALIGTYPLWAPLPAAVALVMIVARQGDKETRRQGERSARLPISLSPRLTVCLLAFVPALALALLDVLPRMRIGQTVLAHEGLVALPSPQRMMPILLALPAALLLARVRAGRVLLAMAALVVLAIGALALAARGGMAAGYHSYKLLFVLTPLAAAIVGAGLARLVAAPSSMPGGEPAKARESHGGATFALPFAKNTALALPGGWLAQIQPSGSPLTTAQRSHNWTRTNMQDLRSGAVRGGFASPNPPAVGQLWRLAATAGPQRRHLGGSATLQTSRIDADCVSPSIHKHRHIPAIGRLSSVVDGRFRWLALGAAGLVFALTGSFQVVPPPATQVITPDIVAAARWLRASTPKEAARALSIGAPAGPLSYWLEVGLLGQSRDKAAAARRDFTIAPPVLASWLIDQQLAPVAITTGAEMQLPGATTLARFGDVAIVRRAGKLDPTPLNPLLIRYRSFWEDQRIKTAIELQRPLAGRLPLLDLRLYHNGTPIADFALPPEQDRTRPQYLGADLLPATLGGEGYINQSDYPIFAAPAVAPTGALSLTLRLRLAGATLEERHLASFERTADGQIVNFAPASGELIYLRHQAAGEAMRAIDLDFGGQLRLTGWNAPARAAAGDSVAIGLRWQAPAAPERGLFPEVQIVDADGRPVAASLAAPQDGLYPTWRWQPGEQVDEQRQLQLPPDLAPGLYQLVARVHDFAAGHTLEMRGSQAGPARIGEIVVE